MKNNKNNLNIPSNYSEGVSYRINSYFITSKPFNKFLKNRCSQNERKKEKFFVILLRTLYIRCEEEKWAIKTA